MGRPKPIDYRDACSLCDRVSKETKSGRRCPHCSGELTAVLKRGLGTTLGKRSHDT